MYFVGFMCKYFDFKNIKQIEIFEYVVGNY